MENGEKDVWRRQGRKCISILKEVKRVKTYIHPNDEKIKEFIQKLEVKHKDLEEVVHVIFKWFDSNVQYSRLNAPFYPLQRSDLDVLDMLSGTCGDYSEIRAGIKAYSWWGSIGLVKDNLPLVYTKRKGTV